LRNFSSISAVAPVLRQGFIFRLPVMSIEVARMQRNPFEFGALDLALVVAHFSSGHSGKKLVLSPPDFA